MKVTLLVIAKFWHSCVRSCQKNSRGLRCGFRITIKEVKIVLLLIREGQPQYGISLAAGLFEASFEICELKLSAFLALGIYIGTEYNLA
jgi:hypothetical protein